MGATSVTGVGPGAADGNKGPGNGREQFVPLLTPHVVAAGTAVLVAGALTVTFPTALSGSETNYAVILTSDNLLASVSAKTDNGDGDFASFAIAGTLTDSVMWCVIKTGNA
jgi:hypothetical protein